VDGVYQKELYPLRYVPLNRAAVLLVGHGSLLDPNSSRPVHDLRSHLCGRFDEVRTAFWKEEPQLHYAFDLIERPEVFVVPVFTSEGYFTKRVVPRELGLYGRLTRRGSRTIHYCDPIGSHPRMFEIVSERAEEAVPISARPDTSVVILGHGTDRHTRSDSTTLRLVDQLQGDNRYARVLPAFLDQEPTLRRVLEAERVGPMVVVPFFISEGWHVGTTIPGDLTPGGSAQDLEGYPLWFAKPVGTHPMLAEVVVEMVEHHSSNAPGGESRGPVASPEPNLAPEPAPLSAVRAKRAFLSWIRSAAPRPRVFLQTIARFGDEARFEIRHEEDRDADPTALRSLESLEQLREVVIRTATGQCRPLKTAPTLQSGWRLGDLNEDELWEAYALLYPAAPVHWYLEREGEFASVPFREAASRQTGLYAGAAGLEQNRVDALVRGCCSTDRCLREPSWAIPGEQTSGSPRRMPGRVPCRAPCAVLFSEASREVALDGGGSLDPTLGSR